MPYKDVAKRLACKRASNAKHAEKNRAYQRAWHAKNPDYARTYREKHRDATRESYKRYYAANLEKVRTRLREFYRTRRAMLIDLLGGKCVDCGGTSKLEFDHRDPTQKLFNIGKKGHRKLDPTPLAELAKCQLRCYDCHKVKTRTDGSKPGRPRKLAARQRGRFMPYTQSALAMPRRLPLPTKSGRLDSRNSSRPEAPIVGRPLLSVG